MPDLVGEVAGAGVKVSHILLDIVAPIGALMAGFVIGDLGVFGILTALSDMLLPEALAPAFSGNQLVNVIWLITATIYFGLAFLALRIGGAIGRILAGLLAGMGLRSLFRDLKGPLAKLKPAEA